MTSGRTLQILVLICALCLTAISAVGMLSEKKTPVHTSGVHEARLLLNQEYHDVVADLLKNARKKIWLSMYVMSYKKNRSFALENQLLKTLIQRHKKGVDVRVILDASLEWDDDIKGYSEKLSKKNDQAYAFLKNNGIRVIFDSIEQTQHSKSLVIDDQFTIIGSTNWTYSALKKNVESSVLINSPEINRKWGSFFEKLWAACEKGSKLDIGSN